MSDQERRIEWMRLDDLAKREAKGNSRVHNLPKLSEAITGLGFTAEPKIDEASGDLIWGHGRLATLRRLRDRGAKVPEGVRDLGDDWAVPVIRGWSSRSKHHAIAVREGDNRQGELGSYDDERRLEALSEIASDAPELLRGIGYESDDLDRLLESASSPAGGPDLSGLGDVADDVFGRPGADDIDEVGSTREEERPPRDEDDDGPGALDVTPAWRTLQPWKAIYHRGGVDGARRVREWCHRYGIPTVDPEEYCADHPDDVIITYRPGHFPEILEAGRWLTRDGQTGRLEMWTRDEFADRFVPANEPARRAQRDAKPATPAKKAAPSAAEMLRNGSGVLIGSVGPSGLQVKTVADALDTAPHE